jgi:chemotaxis protein CheD
MSEELIKNNHYLLAGNIFVPTEPHVITTVLGSCVSVCLWDCVLHIGGMNHFMLPLWNGEGLASPKYGNIAVAKLLDRLQDLGSNRRNVRAKIFGGGVVLKVSNPFMNIGERNIQLAEGMLREKGIPVISSDTGGKTGRKILFNTESGVVLVKRLAQQIDDIRL